MKLEEMNQYFFSCNHCRIAMPSITKVLTKISQFEERFDKIARTLNGLQPKESALCDKDVVREVIQEEKEENEREARKLNVIIHSLTEGTDEKRR